MMRKIINGEPVFHHHHCTPQRAGKEMTAEELHDFAVDVLMTEYSYANNDIFKYDKQSANQADLCLKTKNVVPNLPGVNSETQVVNILVVYKDNLDDDVSDVDTSWMIDEYYRAGSIPRLIVASSWCESDRSENGKPAICGGEFCFIYHPISLIPNEINKLLDRKLSSIELAVKYIEAWKNYDASVIAPYLDKDFHYGSEWVFDEMPSRMEYLAYFQGKLDTIKRAGLVLKFGIGRNHQTEEVAVIVIQNNEPSLLKINAKDGRIQSARMSSYDTRFKVFNPADELYQNHGDHLDCIMPPQDLLANHLREMLEESKLWRNCRTIITTDEMYEEETDVFSLMYGENDIRMLSLIALSKSQEENMLISNYPVTKGLPLDVKINKIIEWDNRIEATIFCSIDEFEFAFFAVDYYCNKREYKVGETITVDLSAFAMTAKEAQREFRFEGQQAIDWLTKVGREITYDEKGVVEPVIFNLENLVAFLDKDSKCPDEAEFQSPVTNIESCSIFGVEFYKSIIKICCRQLEEDELEVSVPLYFRKDFIEDVQENTPVHGSLWMTGSVSGMHEANSDN